MLLRSSEKKKANSKDAISFTGCRQKLICMLYEACFAGESILDHKSLHTLIARHGVAPSLVARVTHD